MIKKECLRASVFKASVVLVVLLTVALGNVAASKSYVSKPGEYSGYSEVIYNGWQRFSQYVPVQVGTANEVKLAVDLFYPTQDGRLFYELSDNQGKVRRLPVIMTSTVYQRAFWLPDGTMYNWFFFQPWVEQLLKHGYVVAVVDIRGTGASYGWQNGPFDPKEARDAYDTIEWFARQSWCNGKVGMFGLSYMGMSQYWAASSAPPSLKCIMPAMAGYNIYDFVYTGGVFQNLFAYNWGLITWITALGIPPAYPSVAVDEDVSGSMLQEAVNMHYANPNAWDIMKNVPYRDSIDVITGENIMSTRSLFPVIERINQSQIPIYIVCGWMDGFVKDAFLFYENLKTPKKLVMGPWEHQGCDPFMVVEHLRWFDYWLKGIDNGIMKEKPITFITQKNQQESIWQSSAHWPLKNVLPTPFFFHKGKTGTIGSVNDGYLKLYPGASGKDNYVVDYSTTTGFPTRWSNCWEVPATPFGYPNMVSNDRKGLTYTSTPMLWDTEVTGHPVVHLWVSSTASDGDFNVYVEEVEPNGYSHYITEGSMRASYRKLGKAPYKYLGLPWHPSEEADIEPLPNEPVELVFDLIPMSTIFEKGNRIRITVTCADEGNVENLVYFPVPTVSVHRDILHSSYVVLPVVLK